MSENTQNQSGEVTETRYEARGGFSTWWWLVALGGCLLYFGFGLLILRMYYYNTYVLRAPRQGVLLLTALVLLVGSIVWLAYVLRYFRRLRFVIDPNGLHTLVGRKERIHIPFSNFETVRLAAWWEAFTKSGGGEGPFQKVGILFFLKQKLPWTKGGTRWYYISPEKPERFLEQLNQVWNQWRQTQGEK